MKTVRELSEFQKDILKQEIELVDKTIARIDEIQLRRKNWCIGVWGGSLYLISNDPGNPVVLILLTAIVPVLFGISDMIWMFYLSLMFISIVLGIYLIIK